VRAKRGKRKCSRAGCVEPLSLWYSSRSTYTTVLEDGLELAGTRGLAAAAAPTYPASAPNVPDGSGRRPPSGRSLVGASAATWPPNVREGAGREFWKRPPHPPWIFLLPPLAFRQTNRDGSADGFHSSLPAAGWRRGHARRGCRCRWPPHEAQADWIR
jgi:hypothetical protein